MEEILRKFIDLLEKESGIYFSLLEIMQSEKVALVESRIGELQEIIKVKENLLLKIRILDEQRHKELKGIAELLETNSQDLTLRILSEMVNEPYSSQLKDSSSKLLSVTQSIEELNNSNRSLLNHSIELVRGSLNLLTNVIPSNQIYQSNGLMFGGDGSGRNLSGVF
jgi:flagellar biosynthesis/type III secretory pathway chaperone